MAKSLLGVRVGELITVADKLSNRDRSYTVIKIGDKYRGELVLFINKVDKDPEAAQNVRSIAFDENDPESYFTRIHEQFGKQGSDLKSITDPCLDMFAGRQIYFTQLFRWVLNDNPLSAWQFITSRDSPGFSIIPLIGQQD